MWFTDESFYTVACDISPFRHSGNVREVLIRVIGLEEARRRARRWVIDHPCGQASILPGHHYWEDEVIPENRKVVIHPIG